MNKKFSLLFLLIFTKNFVGQNYKDINTIIKYQNTISTKIKYNPSVSPIYEYFINVYDTNTIIYNPSLSSINKLHFTKINLETHKIDSFDIIIDTLKHKIEYEGVNFFSFNNNFLVFYISGAKKTFIYSFKNNSIVSTLSDTLNCFYSNCKINDNYLLLYKVYEQPKEDCNLSYTYCTLVRLNDFKTIYSKSIPNENTEYCYFSDINYFELLNNGSIILSGVVDPILKIIDPFTGRNKTFELEKDTNWLQIDKTNVKQFYSKVNPIYAKNRIMFLGPIFDSVSRILCIKQLSDSILLVEKTPKNSISNRRRLYDFYKINFNENKIQIVYNNMYSKRIEKNDSILKDKISLDNIGIANIGNKYAISFFPHADIPLFNIKKSELDAKIENLSNDDYIFYLNIFKINVE